MRNSRWTALLGIAALLAPVAAAFASESAPRATAETPPRIASARPSPAPASVRPATTEAVPGFSGEITCTPAERMADAIAEYYASGRMRLY